MFDNDRHSFPVTVKLEQVQEFYRFILVFNLQVYLTEVGVQIFIVQGGGHVEQLNFIGGWAVVLTVVNYALVTRHHQIKNFLLKHLEISNGEILKFQLNELVFL